MADEPSDEQRRRRHEAAARRQRDEWFARVLGDDWIEVEPGVYRQAGWREPPSGARLSSDALDEWLLEAIAKDDGIPKEPDQAFGHTAKSSRPDQRHPRS